MALGAGRDDGSGAVAAVTSRRPVHGLVNMAAGLVILLIIIPLALRTPQPPPPQIAEFAPQTKQITAPDVNSKVGPVTGGGTIPGGKGNGPGVGPGAGGAPTPTPSPVVNFGSTLCTGSPARQIEDPQSPPCVSGWTGNNGGATAPGVTGTQITVYVPNYNANVDGAMLNFFNSRFETYGRKVVPALGMNGAGGANTGNAEDCNPPDERTQADTAVQQWHAFAATDYNACGGFDFYDEAAHDHLIAVAAESSQFTQAAMAARAPYLWQYVMAQDTLFRDLGQWACALLVGHDAIHAGDQTQTLQKTPRKFGLVVDHGVPEYQPDTSPITSAIQSCGGAGALGPVYDSAESGGQGFDTSGAETALQNMKSQGVTTVFCLCAATADAAYVNIASQYNWYPEWLTSDYLYHQDTNFEMQSWPPQQRADAFGMSAVPRQVRWADNPVDWALAGGAPSGGWDAGGAPPANYTEINLDDQYRSWLLLFSGIQMAGPDLTPQTFQAGLQKTVFPNPTTAIEAGQVGFEGGSHSMTQDANDYWWNNSATPPYASDGSGAICYVADGRRTTPGNWASGPDPFFQPACDSGGYPGQP